MGESTWAEPTLNFFTASQCGSVHRSALEILRRTGVRVFNEEALKLLYMAETAMPIVYSPAPMMGRTTAGGLAIGAAEVLSGLVIHQLKRTGARPSAPGYGRKPWNS